MRSHPPEGADELYTQTMGEHEKGFCSRPYTKQELDAIYGPGFWRTVWRFLLHQSDRGCMIDDGTKGEQNPLITEAETIYVHGQDFAALPS